MNYYKIVIGKEIKGVARSFNFFIEAKGKLRSSTDMLGQFVECDGQLYRDYWMQPIPNNTRTYLEATISAITEQEYQAYMKAKQSQEPIINDEPEEEEEIIIPPIDPESDAMVEYIKIGKINEMSRACRQTIEAGFDLIIRGETKHFSLTTQDQLNLMSISSMTVSQDLIPYHADGEEVMFYTVTEINQIIDGMNQLKNYNIAYYNSLKAYIESLETIEDIVAIEYGTSIPEAYKSDVLKILEQ